MKNKNTNSNTHKILYLLNGFFNKQPGGLNNINTVSVILGR